MDITLQRRLVIAVFLISFVPICHAQRSTGQITGHLTDTTGAVIPGATVTVVNEDTAVERPTTSNDVGYYIVDLLSPGKYRITFQKDGFRPVTRSGITLHVGQDARIDLELEVGSVSQEVLVTADAPLLQATEASTGQVIDNQKIVDLPLNGRDYLQLGLLSVGTNVPPPGARYGGFSSAGMRVDHNTFLLDGMDNNVNQQSAQGRTEQVIKPSIDAIQEFKVHTSTYSAEFGRNVGATVNVALKSGTNKFHGGVFEFLRNESLDARNFFDDPNAPTPPLNRNQFGALLGGPIVPNKTFFFADYEGTRLRTSRTVLSTIPTAKEKVGDFSESIYANKAVQIYDPASYDAATKTRQPFPGAIIPATRLDPIGAKLISFYPEPNPPGIINNYLSNPLSKDNTDKFDVRIDHTLSEKDIIFGRFSLGNYKLTPETTLPAPAFGGGSDSTVVENAAKSFVLSHNHIFSPKLFNSLKIGYNRLLTKRDPPMEDSLSKEIGLNLPYYWPGLANFGITGFRGLGTQASTPHHADSQTRQVTDDLSWIQGKHSVKAGTNLSFIQVPSFGAGRGTGAFTFNGNFTRQTSTGKFGDPLADLHLGIPFQSRIATGSAGNQRRRLYHWYLQDEFAASARLTISVGLRYEYNGALYEKYNHYANLDMDAETPRLILASDGSIKERSTVDPDYNNFAPRLGIAYRVGDRTVVRTGYGLYYGGVTFYGGAYLQSNPPFSFESLLTTDSINPTILLRDGFPPGAVSSNVSNVRMSSQDRNNLTPYSQQWNFTVQHELMKSLSMELGYVGTKGNRLIQRFDSNAPEPGPGNINSRRPLTQIDVPILDQSITLSRTFRRQWSANSNYHSLQAKIEKRFSGGLSFLGSYVWSKVISDGRGSSASGATSSEAQNPRDLQAEKALADEHFPHRFLMSYNYDLPFGRGRPFMTDVHRAIDAVLGGWAIGGITTLNSGRRVTIGVKGNPSNTGTTNRPDATGISPYLSAAERSLDRWFNTDAFVANEAYTYGNVSRNILEAPGSVNFDFAVYKIFQPTERMRVQFRFEAFNFFNTPHFGAPGSTLGTSQFGVISGAAAGRILQFGLKLNF